MDIQTKPNRKSHIPQNSLFFEKVVPVALIVMCVATCGLMVFAAGAVLGFIHF
jgi:hypothetical protein